MKKKAQINKKHYVATVATTLISPAWAAAASMIQICYPYPSGYPFVTHDVMLISARRRSRTNARGPMTAKSHTFVNAFLQAVRSTDCRPLCARKLIFSYLNSTKATKTWLVASSLELWASTVLHPSVYNFSLAEPDSLVARLVLIHLLPMWDQLWDCKGLVVNNVQLRMSLCIVYKQQFSRTVAVHITHVFVVMVGGVDVILNERVDKQDFKTNDKPLTTVCYHQYAIYCIYISPTRTALITCRILKVSSNAQRGSGLRDYPNHTPNHINHCIAYSALLLMEINKHGSTWLLLVKEVELFSQ